MRLADYVMHTLADAGINAAFMVTGGFAMHLNDALAKEERIKKICHHHEQAASYAAEGYGHALGRPALLQITAGPGSINALAGVFGAYTDSIPMVVISGQSKRQLIRTNYAFDTMRQIGEQEADIISMVRPITKYARQILNEDRIVFELQKALYLCKEGRPGPVWLDIPLDVQALEIDPEGLAQFVQPIQPSPCVEPLAQGLLTRIHQAKRPIFVVGPDLSREAVETFQKLAAIINIPVVGAGAQDVILNDSPYFAGRMGIVGTRAGNIAMQNADFAVVFGMRPYLGLVSYNWENMGSNAHMVVVDEDRNEFEKPCSIANECIVCSPNDLLCAMLLYAQKNTSNVHEVWLAFCQQRVQELPAVSDYMKKISPDGRINPYWFVESFSKLADNDAVWVASNASSSVIPLQAAKFKREQRFFSNHGNGAMGFALPAAIGACIALPDKSVLCLEGDGSIMMNIQELQTIYHHQLPIVIVIFNNNGYISIKQTQKNFFGRELGSDASSGVSAPDFVRVANAFGIEAVTIKGQNFIEECAKALQGKKPLILDVHLDSEQGFEPKISSRKLPDGSMVSLPPENMFPFLEEDVLARHVLGNKDL